MSSDHNHGAGHDAGHSHEHEGSALDTTELRVRALESLLTEKGLVDPAALDEIVDIYENRIGPRNGARIVARAWTDPAYLERLRADASAIAEFGFTGRQGEDMVALENTPEIHNMVVCTLCSCYPWPVLGLPPVCPTIPKFASGTAPPNCATSCCRCVRPAPKAGARMRWRQSSPAIP